MTTTLQGVRPNNLQPTHSPLPPLPPIVRELNAHVQQLEERLTQQQITALNERGQLQRHLFQERQTNERLIQDLTAARAEIEQLSVQDADHRATLQRLDAAQQEAILLRQRIDNLGQENQDLTRQRQLERQEVQRISAQLQVALANANALQQQVRQLTHLVAQVLQQQQAPPRPSHLDRLVTAVADGLEASARTTYDQLKGAVKSFFPFMNK
jgi:chromosome segregation ATPase